MVSAGYFEALGIAIVRGRGLSPSDRRNAPRVAVVNRELAERFWPGQDPIGKRIKGIGMQNAAAEIVGVCSNIKTRDLRERWLPTVHVPLQQFYEDTFYFRPSTTLILWTSIDARAVMQPLVQSVERLEPDVPLVHVRTLSEQVGAALASERFLAGLLTASSTLALILAAAGIYGLVSYTTEGRRREFGVRLALGARRSDIVRLVLGQSLRLVALGLALGIGGAMLFAQLLSSFLFGLDPIDPLTFSSAGMLLVSIALAAGSVPARRAASVDPTTLLRTE
jgi:predicted permease